MAVTLTGSKYSEAVTSYASRQLVCSSATFIEADFDTPIIVGLRELF